MRTIIPLPLLAVFSMFLISSCYAPKSYILASGKIREEAFPPIGELNSVELGNSLISEYYVEQAEFIVLKESPTLKKLRNTQIVETKFKFQGYDKMGRLYYNNKSQGILLLPNGDLLGIQYTLADRFAKHELKNQVEYDLIYEDIESEKNFIQEFLYNGKSGNTIKFSYREFNNNLIRPAFTQELQYDLDDSDIIGFRKLRIQIINATNTQIDYKILHSFKD